MAFDVRVEAHIARPPDDVASYMFDPSHDPEWITGIEQVDPPAAPVGVGTETHRLARFMGRRIDYVLNVVEHVPNRRLVMESVQAPFRSPATATRAERTRRPAREGVPPSGPSLRPFPKEAFGRPRRLTHG